MLSDPVSREFTLEQVGGRRSGLVRPTPDRSGQRPGRRGDHRANAAATVPRDELSLKQELSVVCHKAGIPDWQIALKAIFDWIAEASGTERTQKLQVLSKVIEEIKLHAAHLEPSSAPETQQKANQEREIIGQILKMFVEQLPQIK